MIRISKALVGSFELNLEVAARLYVRIGEDDFHHVMQSLGLGRDA